MALESILRALRRALACVFAAAVAMSCGGEPAPSVAPGRYFFAVSPVEAGEFRVRFLPSPSSRGEVKADVWLWRGEVGYRSPDCNVRWAAAEAATWRDCSIAVGSGTAHGWLEVNVSGPRETTLGIVSPRIERAPPTTHGPQVFVFVLDALRADTFESILELRDESSALRRFVSDSIFFENARAPSSWTRPSTASLLTGLHPRRHRVEADLAVISPAQLTLPELLKANGYRTYGWSTNPSVLPQSGYAQGFDFFADVESSRWKSAKPDAAIVFERVKRTLRETHGYGELFYIHLMDPHSPYRPPAPLLRHIRRDSRLRGLFPGQRAQSPDRAFAMMAHTRYLGEVIDLQQKLGAFLEHLREIGAYRDALILLVSDHGEEFLDHGRRRHGLTLYEEQLRVAFVLKLPGNRRAGERIEEAVALEDLLPTVLHVLLLPIPSGLDGRNVFDDEIPAQRSYVGSLRLRGKRLRSIRSGPWKLILDASGSAELYNLEDDPAEQNNLVEAHPERVELLRQELELRSVRGKEGWHLLACGGDETGSIAFSVRGWNGGFREYRLESDDSTRAGSSRGSETLEVALNVVREASRHQSDDDEIVLVPAENGTSGAASVGSTDGRPLHLLLGAGDRVSDVPDLVLDPDDESMRLDPLDWPDCFDAKWKPSDGSHPTLRVWYVPSAEARPPEEIPAPLADRLHALGYLDGSDDRQ